MDECCAVCAEPLEWTGYGPCGHLQTCSKCVARLRFLLKDKRCAICQQETDIVVFTRYMGNYTEKLTLDQFHSLRGGGAYHYLSVINGYFNDVGQFNSIKALCSYTHPEVDAASAPHKFANFRELKMHIRQHLGKQFCEICLAGRKVFVCEQLLYTPQEVKMHMTTGDLIGPLAEGGFKGHPMCEFCRSRFFSETELFKHNSERHETCFMCRRENPQVYRYYRDYADLEEHFKKAHFPCPHPQCIESRFVVFRTEGELKQHFLVEHEKREGSRSQRRGAAAIETNFQYKRPVMSGRGRGRFQLDSRQEYAPSQRMEDFAPPPDSNAFSEQRIVQLTDEDFPSFTDAPSSTTNTWPIKGHRTGGNFGDDDFPSLPGQHAAQQKPAPQWKGQTLASRAAVSRSPLPMRSPASPLPNPNLAPMRNVSSMPQLCQDGQVERQPSPPNWPCKKHREPPPEPQTVTTWVTLSKKQDDKGTSEEFPSLLGEATGPVPQTSAQRQWGRPQEKPKPEQRPKPKGPSISDTAAFPSLGGTSTPHVNAGGPTSVTPQLKVSEGIKSANKVLIKKVKDQMDTSTFQEFHRDADIFLKGGLSAEIFHERLVNHGLAHYVSEVASLCPNANKRSELFSVHSEFIEQCKQNPSTARIFVPVSVVERSYQNAIEHPSWTCHRCATLNLADADFCEACDVSRHDPNARAARTQRPDPVPLVYRRGQSRPRTLFGVPDHKRGHKNAWAKRA